MAAGVNQKQRMLYLERLFKETDRNNALTLVEIVQRLQACEINATEKTLRDDLDQLRTLTMRSRCCAAAVRCTII